MAFQSGAAGIIEAKLAELGYVGSAEVATAQAVPDERPEPDKATEEPKKPKEPSARALAMKKLVFERRPSFILKAWATPVSVEEEKPDDAEEVIEPSEEAVEEPVVVDAEPGDKITEVPELTKEEKEKAEATAKAEAKSAAKAKSKAEKAAKKAAKSKEEKELQLELKRFQRMVTLGQWPELRTYLAGLTKEEAKTGYAQMLTSLAAGPPRQGGNMAQFAEKFIFSPEDLSGLIAASPVKIDKSNVRFLSTLLANTISSGSLLELCLDKLRADMADKAFPLRRIHLAEMLITTRYPVEAGEFLPTEAQAIKANQRRELNFLAQHFYSLYQRERKAETLEQAWTCTQAVLAKGKLDKKEKVQALKRAVLIAPLVRKELGESWLNASFTERPMLGMQILSLIGSTSSTALFMQSQLDTLRLQNLELQTTAAEALLASAPELASEWSEALSLLANNWLVEATHSYTYDTSTQRGPSVNRDSFGNVYYYNYNNYNRNLPKAIGSDKILDIRPSETWLEFVSPSVRPKFDMLTAQLLLKIGEEDEAFPFIENLCRVHPDRGQDLAEEFLRVWTTSHTPNSQNNRTNQYMFVYGWDARSAGIPLTRSKQERNLEELAGWIKRLRALPLEKLDENLIARAFTNAHSQAEVYRMETIEGVFGDLSKLEPKTLSALVEKMRANLNSVWQKADVQQAAKTKRRQRDIQAEVLRGYEVARTILDKALTGHPADWSLTLARASVSSDEMNYRREIEESSDYASVREANYALFAKAAALYADTVGELAENEENSMVFDTWFYASLGATDPSKIKHDMQLTSGQLPLIKSAIEGLGDEVAERHMSRFANNLYTRMSGVNPAVKFNYVRAGLQIARGNERAADCEEVYEYYSDLVTEIKLQTVIDGSTTVGHDEPLGVFVNILHTTAIEREAGGFSKYLVNQNANVGGFNYGRPPEDYRDKFEDITRETLSEHFDVQSITFNHPDTASIATEKYGWRITPYAYLLLKPRGPEVDRIPSIRLDLDFSDTTGYAVLPTESSPLPIDASASAGDVRPFTELALTQTLDERQANEGKLILEIQAKAVGLLPNLDELTTVGSKGFTIESTEDMGLSVIKFDEEGDEIAVRSERTWMVTMVAEESLEVLPDSFAFASDTSGEATMEYQRFDDSDIETTGASVDLVYSYGETETSSKWWMGALALLLGSGAVFGFKRASSRREKIVDLADFRMPESVTPFTVIGLLRDIHSHNGLAHNDRQELGVSIQEIEEHYFDPSSSPAPDLAKVADRWLSRMH